ncbi:MULTISPECIES: helix-turn-helix domain-containing protein [Paenibacillus]|uniref:Sin domain-containing protein n=1 Tax=Paenibacillus naphthalenovorans TaxID=162209 RepID=A0A0U2W5M8_9BACL|nr:MULTISPECIES: helix-turn-helix domain-containing protein [Paenibacillus]ALS20730.1 Sin domain-containing protein [Paenibacillus naphthalenovorans]NTZ17849.1 helix-turn-helix domain-containing protein [Paenibacillus sp. JMULE4]GCL70759.1 helix-turn-helix domain-containing protein [Paenibacillus naphthalenovorans]SDI24001.1 XRE family transcriptional regulator, master regulator for biofilm formation [Paenibacillus naphthalenovorans]
MIGKRIQKLRQKKRLSLSELASRAGVAKSYLSSIERNIQHNPSIEFLHKIAVVLSVDIHNLIREEGQCEVEYLEKEWVQLVREVRASGLSIDEVRSCLSQYNSHA